MALTYDEIIQFEQEKYEDNIARHTFPAPDEKDGVGETKNE